jgi:transposase
MADRRGPYPAELRQRAVRLVVESRGEYESEWEAMKSIAAKLGIGSTETLRKWVRQVEVDAGARPGTTTEEAAELRRLRRENAELRRTNEILRAAAGFFAAELDRPHRIS